MNKKGQSEEPLLTIIQDSIIEEEDFHTILKNSIEAEISEKEIAEQINAFRKEILPYSWEQTQNENQKKEIFLAIDRILDILVIAHDEGLEGLKIECKRLLKEESEMVCFLRQHLHSIVEGVSGEYIVFQMLEQCKKTTWNLEKKFVGYIYVRGVWLMLQDTHVLCARELFMSMLPPECREAYIKTHEFELRRK